jgi:acyl-CoA synthetase (AMP-forming)/AMP-acid ligase II
MPTSEAYNVITSSSNTIGDLIDGAADRIPDHIVVKSPTGSYNCREIYEKSTLVAKYFCSFQFKDGTIGIISPNSKEHFPAVYAAAKAGLAVTTFTENVPISQWKHIVNDFHIRFILFHPMFTTEAIDIKESNPNVILICFDKEISNHSMPTRTKLKMLFHSGLAKEWSKVPMIDSVDFPVVSPQKPALLAFTSGTSSGFNGHQKAVTLTHENVLFCISPPSTLYRPQSFMVTMGWSWLSSCLDLFNSLTIAKTLILGYDESHSYIQSHINAKSQKIVCSGISLRKIVNATEIEIQQLKENCTVLIYTGERMSKSLIIQAIEKLSPEISLIQHYGSTESLLKGCELLPEDHIAYLNNPTPVQLKRLEVLHNNIVCRKTRKGSRSSHYG